MTENGTAGYAITPDGDIEAVFANKQKGAPKGVTKSLIPQAIANGGTKLDCYGAGLVRLYSSYGFIPVARVSFNSEYANPGWDASKGTPDIIFMMHNGDSADTVIDNYDNYHQYTPEELNSLPLFTGENGYDNAAKYRDALLAQRGKQSSGSVQPGAAAQQSGNSSSQTQGDGAVRERGFSENIRTDANRESSLRDAVEASPDMYRQLGNKQTIERAQAVYDKGLAEARSEVEQALGAAKAGQKLKPETVPLAKMVADELTRQGDISGARRIISDIGLELTSAGQLSQAAKLLRSESAATKADFIGALVDRMNAGLTDKQKQTNAKAGRGDADGSIKVSDELIKRYATAPDAEAQNAVLDEIQTQIAEQIPATFTEKWNALRYLNMLGNLKTQERNIIGNMAMAAMTTAKRHTAQALGDLAANLASNGKYEKNTSFAYNPKLYAEARADANARMDEIRGDVKYSDSRRIAEKGIQDRRRIFKSRIVEGARKLTNWAMEAGDDIFLRFNYADAMAGWMQAHGIKSARAFATKEAQEATFHDSNRVSDYVSQLGRTPKTLPLVKTLSEGMLPFRKTPANVAVRAVEYSPVGLANTIYTGIQAKKGNATAADVINAAAKSATGTALAAAGYFLAAVGRARATGDDSKDKKEKYFEQMRGEMDYSIKIGDTSVSLSQFAPTAVPFFMGAKLFEGMDGRVTLDDALMVLGCITCAGIPASH